VRPDEQRAAAEAGGSGRTVTRDALCVHLTSVHSAADERILQKECRTLSAAGYRVVLVAPNAQDDWCGGVRIRAVPPPHGRVERMTRTAWRCLRAGLQERGGVYHVHDPELLGVALLLKLFGRIVIYDVHEDLPRQILDKHWIFRPLRRAVAAVAEAMEWLAGRMLDGVVAATPLIASRFPVGKTVVVHNYPILEALGGAEGPPYADRSPKVVYVGGIAETRGLREMLAAVGQLPPRLMPELVLAGRFSPAALEAQAKTWPGWERTRFVGWQSRDVVAGLLCQARVGLVVLHPRVNYLDSYPVKLFEYMASGLPVVASDFPLWRQIVSEARCGLLVDPLDAAAIAAAVAWLLEHPDDARQMGERGRRAVEERYNWESEAPKLLACYERLIQGGAFA
jgi:glycosyltransferase involved in cell wall biosynthesis